MAREAKELGLRRLERELSPAERARIGRDLAARVGWLRTLRAWPRFSSAPEATPIVALYAAGDLVGCAWCKEDVSGGERLARAFVSAVGCGWGGALPRENLAVEVAYARRTRPVDEVASIEVGVEGVALWRPESGPVILLPQVARDFGAGPADFVQMLRRKAGPEAPGERLFAWTAERVVGRQEATEELSGRAAARARATPEDFAAAWLARLVGPDGAVAFAIDPRRRMLQPLGELHHARSAVAVEALAAHGGHPAEVARARRWLGREVARALGGRRVEAWPEEAAAVAGTLALVYRAGVDVRAPLVELANRAEVRAAPWHAGQVALALGRDAPEALWAACVADLARQSFAPWTAKAARERGDEPALRQAAAGIAGFVRKGTPHAGGAAVTAIPETGLTAVAAHALAGLGEHRAARQRALAFVRARQLLPGRIPAALDPGLSLGGFSATPVLDVLRGDIVGHALLALGSARR